MDEVAARGASSSGAAQEGPRRGRTPVAPLRSAASAEALLLDVVARHGDRALALARRHSLCADDAHDAYQRGLELFLVHGRRLHAETAHRWLLTVCRHEAQALRRSRSALVGWEEAQLDRVEARHEASPEEQVLERDAVTRGADALRTLKAAEIRALRLRAAGSSYAEIQRVTGWSFTKVNRSLTEGRRSFAAAVARLEDGAGCAPWADAVAGLAAGTGTPAELLALRPHLDGCSACRATLRRLRHEPRALVALPWAGVPATCATPAQPVGPPWRWLSRGAEVLSSSLQQRMAAGGTRLQALLEAGTTGKLAVVASSAAMLAGGGTLATHRVREPAGGRAVVVRVAGARPAPVGRALAATRAPRPRPQPPPRRAAAVRGTGARAVARRSAATRTSPRPRASPPTEEFDVTARAARAPARRAGAAVAPGEFAVRVRTPARARAPGAGAAAARGEFGP